MAHRRDGSLHGPFGQVLEEQLGRTRKADGEPCDHEHTPYRCANGMPCTGPLICTGCDALWDPGTGEAITAD